MPSEFELLNEVAPRAMESVLELRLDDALTNTIDRLTTVESINRSPWLLCYQAMERRMNISKQNITLSARVSPGSFCQATLRFVVTLLSLIVLCSGFSP